MYLLKEYMVPQPLHVSLNFRPFSHSDYPEYVTWFEYEQINTALGPIDQEWLHYILYIDEGAEYAVYKAEDLVAVVGILIRKPGENGPPYSVITNLAVNPKLFRTGIGSAVVEMVFPLSADNQWVAYVSERNLGAQTFFEKNGWVRDYGTEEGMLTYRIFPGD